MRLQLIALLTSLSLMACGQSEQAVNTEAAAAPVESAPAQPVVEYVWNKTGPNYSEDQLPDIVARWYARIDAGGYQMLGANVLKPQFETDQYDLIWVLMWPSEEARAAAWADWSANQAEAWLQEMDGTLSYAAEDVYAFHPKWGHQAAGIQTNVGDQFIPIFSFCSLNEGQDETTFAAFRAEFDAWLTGDEMAPGYSYVMLEPQFEMDEGIDMVWLDLFADEASMMATGANWSGSAIEEAWNAMASCEDYRFLATAIRR